MCFWGVPRNSSSLTGASPIQDSAPGRLFLAPENGTALVEAGGELLEEFFFRLENHQWTGRNTNKKLEIHAHEKALPIGQRVSSWFHCPFSVKENGVPYSFSSATGVGASAGSALPMTLMPSGPAG